ncbi:MAG: hypothetical protein JL56_00835, partial [Desulfotomaculum sp. BICA1-6]
RRFDPVIAHQKKVRHHFNDAEPFCSQKAVYSNLYLGNGMAMIKAIKKADDAMAATSHFFQTGSLLIKKIIVAIIVSGTRDTLNIVSHIKPKVIHTFPRMCRFLNPMHGS